MPASRIRSISLLILLGTAHGAAFGHDGGHDGGHAAAASLFLGVGLQSLHVDHPWPAARLPGVLESGSPYADDRGERVGYIEVGLRTPLPFGHTGEISAAKHEEDGDVEIESAWIAGDTPLAGHATAYRLGRQYLPLGRLNLEDPHSRGFGVDPLALRAVLNGSWRADGVRVDVEWADGWDLGAGLWVNDSFPGAPSGAPRVAHLRTGYKVGDWQFEAGYARAQADGRALSTIPGGQHSHSLPSCGSLEANRVCFFGDVDVVNLSLLWAPENQPWWLEAEWLAKWDKGRLDSLFGTPDYDGRVNGGWLDLGWSVTDSLDVVLRVEQTVATHDLTGANATLVAAQSGIATSDDALTALGLAFNWRPKTGHFLSAEWHREDLGAGADNVYMLRYQFDFAHEFWRSN